MLDTYEEVGHPSFELEGDPEELRYRYDCPRGDTLRITAEFDFTHCTFQRTVKRLSGSADITGTSLEVGLLGSTLRSN